MEERYAHVLREFFSLVGTKWLRWVETELTEFGDALNTWL